MNIIFARAHLALYIGIVAVVVAASTHWSSARADDTELFFSGAQNVGNTPNVLLFLDNSGSMRVRLNYGAPDSRSQVMVQTVETLLGTLSGVDVGLATFNGGGASILAPVRPLDAPALGDSVILSKVDRSRDDAAIYASGSQSQWSQFPMTHVGTPQASVYTNQVSGSNPVIHDAAGSGNGPVKETVRLRGEVVSFDLRLSHNLEAISPFELTLPQASGLSYAPLSTHFNGIETYPVLTYVRFSTDDMAANVLNRIRGGCVMQSYIEFQSASYQPDPDQETKLYIQMTPNNSFSYVPDTQPATVPTSGPGFDNFIIHLEYTEAGFSENLATPFVRWDAIASTDIMRTPDLSNFIQSGIVHETFQSNAQNSPDNNYLNFSFSPYTVVDGDLSDGSIYGLPADFELSPPPAREFLARNGDENDPTLIIVFTDEACRAPAGNADKFMLGAVFRDLRIPRGAAINDARIHLRPVADYLSREDFRMNIYAGRIEDPDAIDWQLPVSELSSPGVADNVVWIDPGRSVADPGELASTRTSIGQWLAVRDATSPDISNLIQSIVNDPDWCGGQSIVIYVEPRKLSNSTGDQSSDSIAPLLNTQAATFNQLRAFHTYDSSPQLAPSLQISHSAPSDVNNACNVYEASFLPEFADSAFQDIDSSCQGSWYGSAQIKDFERPETRLVFLHFRDINLPEDAMLLGARVFMSNHRQIRGEIDAYHPRFMHMSVHLPPTLDDVLTHGEPGNGVMDSTGLRCKSEEIFAEQSSDEVIWDLGTEPYDDPDDPHFARRLNVYRETPDFAPQIARLIAGPTWADKPTVSFIMHGDSDLPSDQSSRIFNAYGLSNFFPTINSRVPIMLMLYRSNLYTGDAIMTHRQQLINIVKNMVFSNSYTPYYAALRESVSYFRNDEVYFGRRRAPGPNPDFVSPIASPIALLDSRVSTVHSHNGTIIRPPECSDFLSSPKCSESKVTAGARYTSADASQTCESNHIIFLTDGESTGYEDDFVTTFQAWVDSTAGHLQCDTDFVCADSEDPDLVGYDFTESKYYNRLASYVSSDEFITPNNPLNNEPVRIHTIGFGVHREQFFSGHLRAQTFLRTMAASGRGDFHVAGSSGELLLSFQGIFDSITTSGSSLSSPSLTINAFNSLFTLDEIYVSMFVPQADAYLWQGNIKKYRLRNICLDSDSNCTVGELLDARGEPVLDEDQSIDPDAQSLWSTGPDGDNVTRGGAAQVLGTQNPYPRALFTDKGKDTISGTYLQAEPLNEIKASNAMSFSGELRAAGAYTPEAMMDWWNGIDIGDENNNGNTTENRWLIQDSLHSSIVPIIFAHDATLDQPVLKLFAATNAGEIRMINGNSGEEEWRYVPRDQLEKAADALDRAGVDITDNPNSNRLYGIDGPMSPMVFDCNGDGTIQSNPGASDCSTKSTEVTRDRVLIFAAQRRGGDKIYAFEAVPGASITDSTSTSSVTPRFLWTIDSQTPGYSELGQTWSQVVPMRIYSRNPNDSSQTEGSQLVVAFAGGYDTSNDLVDERNEPKATNIIDNVLLRGASIYMADMFTGACVLHIGRTFQNDCEYSTVTYDMKYSVAMTPGFLNSGLQGDTSSRRGVDRFYFADLGGQMFRVDLNQALVNSTTGYAKINMIANIGQDADSSDAAENRRQFYTSPIVVPVRNDYTYSNTEGNYDLVIIGSGTRPYPRSTGTQDRAYVLRDINATTVYGPTSTVNILTESDLVDTTLTLPGLVDLRASSGFYFNLDLATNLNGEKIISQGTVLAGTWFFTSYTPDPPPSSGACSSGSGVSSLYAINILNASPAIDQNNDGSIDISDRSTEISTGLVSDIATAFLEGGTALLINAEGSSRTLDTGGVLGNLDTPVMQSRRQW
ncbi:MAG: hypothetical protein K8963_03440 [Proteobacteria bacterium]|nr:hypothetical protein [Pseudomonadota bacterium]